MKRISYGIYEIKDRIAQLENFKNKRSQMENAYLEGLLAAYRCSIVILRAELLRPSDGD